VVLPWLFIMIFPWPLLMAQIPGSPMVPSWPSIVVLPWSLLSPGPSFLVVLVCPSPSSWSWPCLVDLGLDISSSLVSLFFLNFFLSPCCFHLL
ncbi:hypothetical protein EDB19DRAFT_1727314, partial [Suillus lakei]